MRPVLQEDPTGCAIASVAAIAGQSYTTVKALAVELGFSVDDTALWTSTHPVRELLHRFHFHPAQNEEPFVTWHELPPLALLSIKWHREPAGPAWHWVVFAREGTQSFVLDSKRSLRNHRRTDFGRMKPKWFIRVNRAPTPPLSHSAAHPCSSPRA